jgi:hypothetical protein
MIDVLAKASLAIIKIKYFSTTSKSQWNMDSISNFGY